MNQRESTGLPLRAMVMVLLFLGLVFLLVGLQAVGSDSDGEAQSTSSSAASTPSSTGSTSSSPSSIPPAARPEVRVYNISEVAGAAEQVAVRLRDQQWNAQAENLSVTEPPGVTTVYWGNTPGEEDAARDVGAILGAPVEPRIAGLADQPPGIVVLVTG